jgi:type I restriction enzyme M protein
MIKNFLQAKSDFDSKYGKSLILENSIVPVDGKHIENISLKNQHGEKSEEYYKWQFIYSLVHSGLFSKDYLGAGIYFPKGNKNSAPLKIDACVLAKENLKRLG